jgi:serine/threonine protein kinase
MAATAEATASPDAGAETSWDLPQVGTVIGGRYRLDAILGEGGMSLVYVAYDQRLQRNVAFKLLVPSLAYSREVVTRFVNEARTLARLDSPHIVRVYDAGVTSDPERAPLPFMVLELLRGWELRTLLDQRVTDQARIVGWMLEACEGLAAAHAGGVIHRDLKPENLFLTAEADGGERLKILDFGIARSIERDAYLTLEGEGVGSPGYMSPEQLRDASSVDARSDIWALGVVMYELFSGTPPFHAKSSLELCAQVLNDPIEPLSAIRRDLPAELTAVVDRCLQRDPNKRFTNVLELAQALSPFARPSRLVVTERIRRRLEHVAVDVAPERAMFDDSDVALSRTEVAGIGARPVLESGTNEREREHKSEVDVEVDVDNGLEAELEREAAPITGVRRRSVRARVARSFAYLSIAGLLTLLAAAAVPNAGERTTELMSSASARLSSAADVAEDWFRRYSQR